MTTQPIRIGIIGCGVIAPAHIESYRLLPGVAVTDLCDIQPGRMAELAAKYPDQVFTLHANHADLLAAGGVDAVSVCTDHASHEAIVLAALSAGRHVLCEKALTINVESLGRMVDAARRAPVVSSGIFQHRFDPVYSALRAIIAEGGIGRLLSGSVQHACYRSDDYYRADAWRGTWSGEGGSLLINQSIHYIDILQWVMGGVASVQAHTANLAHEGVIETEDTAALSLAFRGGALGTFTATSASHHGWENAFQITGTDGEIRLRNGRLSDCFHRDPARAEALRARLTGLHESDGVEGAKIYYGSSHPAQIRDFVDAIRERRRPFVTLEDACGAVRVVLAAYESARTGARVEL